MRLKRVKIGKYKCFDDSNYLEINDGVTCLVGVNEAGKSAFFEALYKVDPIEKSDEKTSVFETEDFPIYLDRSIASDTVAVESIWIIEESDERYFIEKIGFNPIIQNEIIITKNYKNKNVDYAIKYMTEIEACKKLESILSVSETINSIEELVNIDSQFDDSDKKLFESIKEVFDTGYEAGIEYLVYRKTPSFLLFSEAEIIDDRLPVDNTIINMNNNNTVLKERILIALLESQGKTIEEIRDMDNESRDLYLDMIGNKISIKLSKYFKKIINFDFGIKYHVGTNKEVAPYNTGTYFSFVVKDKDKNLWIRITKRSKGMQWYLSLFLLMNHVEDIHDRIDIIFLLDEPGLHLHGEAQEKIVNYIYDDIQKQKTSQVIYSTHSPFMIDKTELLNVRTISKIKNRKNIFVSRFKNTPINNKDNSVMPLRAALGYNLSQSLFVGRDYLIVEGCSDVYYINAINKILKKDDKLLQQWMPIISKKQHDIPKYQSFYESNKLNVVLAIDYNKVDEELLNKIRSSGMQEEQIVLFPHIINKTYADIEDLLGEINYLHLLKLVYPIEIEPRQGNKARLMTYCDKILKDNNIKVNHAVPARHLLDTGFTKIGFPEKDLIIRNFKELFRRINLNLERN